MEPRTFIGQLANWPAQSKPAGPRSHLPVGQVLTKFWIPEGDSGWIQWGGPRQDSRATPAT